MLPVILGQGGNGYYAEAVRFDGTNSRLLKTTELTGLSDGKVGTFSAWLKFSALRDGQFNSLIENSSTTRIRIRRETDGDFTFYAVNSGATVQALGIQCDETITSSNGWVHILASWDVANALAHIYVNDASSIASSPQIIGDTTIDYTRGSWCIGSRDTPSPADTFAGDMADYYMNFEEYFDITVEANRRKFIDANGKPVFLGADGSLPTGTVPHIFLSQQQGDVPSDFGTNKGDGGNFTISGTLTASPDSPSD